MCRARVVIVFGMGASIVTAGPVDCIAENIDMNIVLVYWRQSVGMSSAKVTFLSPIR